MTDSKKPLDTTRRNFIAGSAAAVSTFFIGRPKAHAGDAEITLKFATVAPSGTPWSKHTSRLKKRVKEGTDGRVKIKVYLGGGLGDEESTLSRTRKRGIAGWAGSAGALASIIPEVAALELPYLFPSVSAADDILDNKITRDMEKMLEKAGFKLLFFSENGHRSIGTNFGFVKSTADLKGKKMRSQSHDVHLNTWRAFGASPQPIAVTEAMTALQTGVVDGFDNTPLFTFAASWFQAITHFTLTRHSYQPALAVMNLDIWNDLPADVQALIAGDIKKESEYGRKTVRAIGQQLIDNFAPAGVQVHDSTRSELEAFAKATKPTHKKFTDKYGSAFYKAITKHL
ncbi:TRAP-type transport system, periplasmic component, putative N-acetylneuraminate-binding protein [Enhygromyxa salina]|uniref:TRAP-type transport system, periplasmic component, putative N-acetylneuraminate-binding protein n=1 Tax=Enhygromyxa salina TaxID=215803 RepID=A0A0C2D6G0_9BACT|nr:TRAP transporter substrate-binding protein [Enhygromyxa salina]KIG18741.1 TRAP-type transport system, periplasmic component, putative N-acetylneuraminate-binding protein [Enhygromyxa salina]